MFSAYYPRVGQLVQAAQRLEQARRGGVLLGRPETVVPLRPLAVVAVAPDDPALQGNAPGVRLNDRPLARAQGALPVADLPNGVIVAVLSTPAFDREGRQWRFVEVLGTHVPNIIQYAPVPRPQWTGWAPFADPSGVENMRHVSGSPSWSTHAAGARSRFDPNRFG